MCSPLETVDESEIIKDRLYFATLSQRPTHQYPDLRLFSTDDELVYCNYNADFGPLNLAMLCRFCDKLNRKLKLPSLAGKKLVYFTGIDVCKRTNAAFLIGSYCILYLGRSADETYVTIAVSSKNQFRPYRDASAGPCSYNLSLLDVLHAVAKASQLRFIDFTSFDVEDYEHYERVENGDMNWIVPRKFLAFSSPHERSKLENGYPLHAPEVYIPYFRRNNVRTVIRLNNRLYDSWRFVNAGVAHHDLIFVDGGTPSDEIVQRFLAICEKTDGAVAVHCKAGLGRTGTLIGCYLMKHFRFTAAEAIGWMRIARPGSVLGPQQQFLEDKQQMMWKQGETFRQQVADTNGNHKVAENAADRAPTMVVIGEKLAVGGHPVPEGGCGGGPPLTSQGDQLNRLKMQRCRKGVDQAGSDETVKRKLLQLDVSQQQNSLSRNSALTRTRN